MSRRWVRVALCGAAVLVGVGGMWHVRAQEQQQSEDIVRRAKNRVDPVYPELATKMHIGGTVKIEVTVAPNGTVKDAKIVGGHPVLATAALDAARKWRFEPAPAESTGIIDFKFTPR